MKNKEREALKALFIISAITLLTACAAKPAVRQESPVQASQPAVEPGPETSPEPTPERVPYDPMDLFSEEFCPCGADWSGNFTVFEASFDKSATEGKSRFVLSMTGSGDMFACVAYQADIAGLSEDEKNARINEYLEGGYCHIDGKDGRWVDIRRADPNDDRYAYVEADGQHGQNGAGCVIDISYFIEGMDDACVEKYKDDISAKYTYFTKGALEWCYPDTETVRQMFNAAFGTEGDDFYHAPYERFRQYVQERFRMSVEELYALPVNQG